MVERLSDRCSWANKSAVARAAATNSICLRPGSILNLISNAAKFTKDGRISLSVDRSAGEGGEWISFAVSDSGIGIPADKIDSLFEEFSQVDASTTRDHGGTGSG